MGLVFSCCILPITECLACFAFSFAACILNFTLSQASRAGHLIIALLVFILAIILGRSYPNLFDGTNSITSYNGMTYGIAPNLTSGCDVNYVNECIYRQLMYRASFACVILFVIIGTFSYFFEYVNKRLWVVKLLVVFGTFTGFLFVDNEVFSGYAEAARVISFFWLLVQGLLFLDFAHDSHDLLMQSAESTDEDERWPKVIYGIYLFLSLAFLACAGE